MHKATNLVYKRLSWSSPSLSPYTLTLICMAFYSQVHPKSITLLHSIRRLQTNGIKRHLACSAQSTSLSLKAVKSFRINFCWKFSVLSVFFKWFLPLLLELNGPTMQHNLSDGTLVLLQHSQLMFLFYCWCVCACVCQQTQHKNVFSCLSGVQWPSTHPFCSIQTLTLLFTLFRLVTQYETRSNLQLTIWTYSTKT